MGGRFAAEPRFRRRARPGGASAPATAVDAPTSVMRLPDGLVGDVVSRGVILAGAILRVTNSLPGNAFMVAQRDLQGAIVCLPVKPRTRKLREIETHRRVIVVLVAPINPLDISLGHSQFNGQRSAPYIPALWAHVHAYSISRRAPTPLTGEHLDLPAQLACGHGRLDPQSADLVKPPSAHQAIQRDTVDDEVKKGSRRVSADVSVALGAYKLQNSVLQLPRLSSGRINRCAVVRSAVATDRTPRHEIARSVRSETRDDDQTYGYGHAWRRTSRRRGVLSDRSRIGLDQDSHVPGEIDGDVDRPRIDEQRGAMRQRSRRRRDDGAPEDLLGRITRFGDDSLGTSVGVRETRSCRGNGEPSATRCAGMTSWNR